MFTDLLSYVDSIAMRVKMYKVWAAPVIEFFLLQEALNNNAKFLSNWHFAQRYQGQKARKIPADSDIALHTLR